MKKILVLSDNYPLLNSFVRIVKKLRIKDCLDYGASPNFLNKMQKNSSERISSVDVKSDWREVVQKYDLVLSLHCQQIFPKELVTNCRCVNIHPGFNPYNRGWYPHIFSIINGLPAGVTVHEIDEYVDHGPIIVQEKITIEETDTSYEVYQKIQNLELQLIEKNLTKIISGNYSAKKMVSEGNINTRKDFKNLCQLDLDEKMTLRETINLLRALSHRPYYNAYFTDEKNQNVKVSLQLHSEVNET